MLEHALDAILAQEFTDFELIIADNASTDDTPQICRAYAERDSRITYHAHSVNESAVFNFEWVRNEARGEFFVWTAHDDVWKPQFLHCCVAALAATPQAAMCTTLIVIRDAISGDEQVIDLGFSGALKTPIERLRIGLNPERAAPMQNLLYGVYRCKTLRCMPPLSSLAKCWGSDRFWVLWLLACYEIVQVDEPLFEKVELRHSIKHNAIVLGAGTQKSVELALLSKHCLELMRIPWRIPGLSLGLRIQMTLELIGFVSKKALNWLCRRKR